MIEQRIERKLPVDLVGLEGFREWHLLHGAAFREVYAPRLVQSVYFDSIELADFADNVDGVSERSKLRLRWYGDSVHPAVVRLECKQKRAGVSWKHAVAIESPPSLARGLRRTMRGLRAEAPPELRPVLDTAPQPTLWNRYRREYFATRDGLRLTVDTELEAADVVRDRLDPRRMRPSAAARAVIELKFPMVAQGRMEQLLCRLPLRVARHSKYVSGVENGTW